MSASRRSAVIMPVATELKNVIILIYSNVVVMEMGRFAADSVNVAWRGPVGLVTAEGNVAIQINFAASSLEEMKKVYAVTLAGRVVFIYLLLIINTTVLPPVETRSQILKVVTNQKRKMKNVQVVLMA